MVLWKPADALAAANECLKSLGLKYLVQTGNVFVVESLNEGFPLQVSPQLTAATSRSTPKFGIMCTYILFLHTLTSHDDKLPTFWAFWFEIVEVSSRF